MKEKIQALLEKVEKEIKEQKNTRVYEVGNAYKSGYRQALKDLLEEAI